MNEKGGVNYGKGGLKREDRIREVKKQTEVRKKDGNWFHQKKAHHNHQGMFGKTTILKSYETAL